MGSEDPAVREKSVWDSIITFVEDEDNKAPFAYQGDGHVPEFDDLRGGCLDVAEVAVDAPRAPGEIAGLRFGVADKNGAAVVVLDPYQVAILINAMRGWLDREVPTG